MVEGAPLLREYEVKNFIEGSNPSLSAREKNVRRKSAAYIEVYVSSSPHALSGDLHIKLIRRSPLRACGEAADGRS